MLQRARYEDDGQPRGQYRVPAPACGRPRVRAESHVRVLPGRWRYNLVLAVSLILMIFLTREGNIEEARPSLLRPGQAEQLQPEQPGQLDG